MVYEFLCKTGHSGGHIKTVDAANIKACADICAKEEAECYSIDYDQSAKKCSLKRLTTTTPYTVTNAFYPVGCPKPHQNTPNKKPEITNDLTCPFSKSGRSAAFPKRRANGAN